jgi:RNA-directed DNA polymerase
MKSRNGLRAKDAQENGIVMNKPTEEVPAAVPATAKQAGDVRARWAWTEPAVWTERMLAALENGVRGGQWFSLIDKVYAPANLERAFQKVKGNGGAAGVDHQTIEMFEAHLAENLEQSAQALKSGTYRPQPVRRIWIDKPGTKEKRPLGIPTIRDRVVQSAMRHVLEPIFERDFAEDSYGFRPNRSAKDALRRVDNLLKAGYYWVVDADLKSYFDTIPHEPMMKLVATKVADGRVMDLIEAMLKQGVMHTVGNWQPEQGTPQGAVISPLLSNIYLDPLDQLMVGHGIEMIRYADDFVILCRSEADALQSLEAVTQWTAKAGLALHPQKTRIVDATQPGGFDFLGYHFERGYRWPRRKSLQKLQDSIRSKTKRNNGCSLSVIIWHVNRTLKGWFQYFRHSHRTTFPMLDSWIRMRLRSILRRRYRGRGCGRGLDHRRWPNAFFAEHGLFSLAVAHAQVCRSSSSEATH